MIIMIITIAIITIIIIRIIVVVVVSSIERVVEYTRTIPRRRYTEQDNGP